MDWTKMKHVITSLFEVVSGLELKAVRISRANAFLYLMRLGVTVLLYAICFLRHGRFFSGIDYAGHGVWGWIGLWFTCACAATLLLIVVMWILGITPLKRPRWDCFAFGLAFLSLFLSGLSSHVPSPVLGELMVGSAAALLLYLGVFVEKQ